MKRILPFLCAVVLFSGAIFAGNGVAGDPLAADFAHPPDSDRPLTWWHWLDGNITREGITGDLEAMKRAGLGGVYLFNCGVGMPQGPVRFMQPRWLEMMDHAMRETARLGLDFGVHNCDGFSQSGGPWITPEHSMKKLVWTATDVGGPAEVNEVLEQPETKEGFYRDVAVIAFPIPAGEVLTPASLRGSLETGKLARLADGDVETTAVFPVREDGHTVEFVFGEPRTVRSLVCRNAAPHKWEKDFPIGMEVSDDGKNFRPVGAFSANWDFVEGGSITAACENATGRVFRLTFENPWPVSIGEIELSEAARVHFGEAKAARMRSRGHGAERKHMDAFPGLDRGRALPPERIVARDAVKNISGNMSADGRLQWEAPPGRWRILRVGFTSNGHRVAPATPEGRGLECDKLDADAVRFHLEQYAGKLAGRPAAEGGSLKALEVDSWECGIQNWTEGFEQRFRDRVGYDLLAFLPALLEGWIVDSPDVTERALWDWRRFLADQFSESYFGVVAQFAGEKGLTYVGESTGRQQFLYDVAWMRNSAVPMGEFWNNTEPGQGVRVDNKVASSIAHTTGGNVVAAEAFTSGGACAGWDNHPFTMKALGDEAFCAGVNQFVFHTFAHQPYRATGPGFTFASWGLNFNRANTWWDAGRAWIEYLTRCNHLLRRGQPVSDVLFYVGEDVPNRIAWNDELHPVLPRGYAFDGCDTRAVMEARVQDGRIVLPGGAEYRVLLLPDLQTMRPAVLEKIRELVAAGAVVLGPRPVQSPSLRDRGEGDKTVRRIAAELWEGGKAARVASGISFEELFQRMGLAPDFEWRAAGADAEVLFTHRREGDAEIYFVSNQKDRFENIEAVFRVEGRAPELWDAATGAVTRPGVFTVADGRTTVPLRLPPSGSVFVVFRDSLPARHAVSIAEEDAVPGAPGPELEQMADGQLVARVWQPGVYFVVFDDGGRTEVKVSDVPGPETVPGPWRVSFPAGRGAPETAMFERLESWTERPEPGIRFFSGTATYEKEIDLPAGRLAEAREWYLDLGEVFVMAEVEWNGSSLGTLWKPPFRVRVDGVARAGANRLVVRVTNLWRNRMIGDASLPDDDIEWNAPGRAGAFPSEWPDWLEQGKPRPGGRIAFCTRKDVYKKDDPLLPSGLLGPVTLRAAAKIGVSTQ